MGLDPSSAPERLWDLAPGASSQSLRVFASCPQKQTLSKQFIWKKISGDTDGKWRSDSWHACGEEAPTVALLRDGAAGALGALFQHLGEGCFWEAFPIAISQICHLQLLGKLLKQRRVLLGTEVQPACHGGAPGCEQHWLHSVSSAMKYEKDLPSGCCKISPNICHLLRTQEASSIYLISVFTHKVSSLLFSSYPCIWPAKSTRITCMM